MAKRASPGRRPRTSAADPGTESEILRAARTVFARKGFEGASTREVAELAGVNNAMIYYHFADKRELYRAVLGQAFWEFDRIWDHPVLISEGSAREKIQTYVEGIIRFQQGNEDIRRIMTMEFASCSRDNYQWIADTHVTHNYERLSRILRQAMKKGEIRKVSIPHAIAGLVGMINYSFIMRPLSEHVIGRKLKLDPKKFGSLVTTMFFDGFGM